MTDGTWARGIARQHDALAEDFESRPDSPTNRLGAESHRAEAEKYYAIAARMDTGNDL